MKKSKFVKFLVMALSLALLIGSAIAFAAGAEEDSTYDIISINIAHEDTTNVLIAVDAIGVDPATIEVKYTIGAGEEKTAKYYDLVDIYKDGNQYPVFYTVGIPAKDMGEDVIAEAHVKGAEGYTAKTKDVSVANYLYTKLYKEGFITEIEGEAAEKRAFYESMLRYGANAQEVLWNNNNPDNTRTLITDYIAVYAENGIVNGKGDFALLKSAGTVNVAYNGDKTGIIDGWNVTTFVNNKARNDIQYTTNTVTITKSAVISANVVPGHDFEGAYTDVAGEGTAANKITFEDGLVAKDGKTITAEADGTKTQAYVVADATGNHYLHLTAAGRNTDGNNRGNNFVPVTNVISDNPNVYVLSFDFMYDEGLLPSNGLQVVFYGNSYAQFNASQAFTIAQIAPKPGVWYNLRFEFYYKEGVCQLYRDGRHITNITKASQGNTDSLTKTGMPTSTLVGIMNSTKTSIYFDDVAAYKAEKTYVDTPVYEANVYDFEGAYTETTVNLKEDTTSNNIKYGNVYANIGTGSSNTTGESKASIVDLGGNKALNIFSPGRKVGTDYSHSILLTTENVVREDAINATVIEFSMLASNLIPDGSFASKVSNDSFLQINFRKDVSNYIVWNMHMTDVIKFANVTIGKPNEWINLKLIYKGADHKVEIYVDNVYAGELNFENRYEPKSITDEDELFNRVGAYVNEVNLGAYNGGGMIDITIDDVKAYNTYIAPAN